MQSLLDTFLADPINQLALAGAALLFTVNFIMPAGKPTMRGRS